MGKGDEIANEYRYDLNTCKIIDFITGREYTLINFYDEDTCIEDFLGTGVSRVVEDDTILWRFCYQAFTFTEDLALSDIALTCDLTLCDRDTDGFCNKETKDGTEIEFQCDENEFF